MSSSDSSPPPQRRRLNPPLPSLPPPIWLDLFPLDLRLRIVEHLTACRQTQDGYNIAASSEHLREAVLVMLDNKLTLSDDLQATTWGKTYLSNVSQVGDEFDEYSRESWISIWLTTTVQPSGESLRLQHLSVSAMVPLMLRLIRLQILEDLQELTIDMRRVGESTRVPFLEAISSIKSLRKLRLDFRNGGNHAFRLFGASDGLAREFATRSFPNLHTLHMDACEHDRPRSFPWTLLSNFDTLNEVRVQHPPTHDDTSDTPFAPYTLADELLEFLIRFPIVRLAGRAASVDVAQLLGERLTELDALYVPPLSTTDLSRLTVCSQLQILSLERLSQGAERELPALVRCTPHLRELRLCWVHSQSQGRVVVATAVEGKVREAVSCVPSLSVLHVRAVRILASEVKDVLEFMGGRLREFNTTPYHQEEMAIERTQFVMQMVAQYNHEIRKLSFSPRIPTETVPDDRDFEMLEAHRSIVWATLSQLEQQARFLDSLAVEFFLGSVYCHRDSSDGDSNRFESDEFYESSDGNSNHFSDGHSNDFSDGHSNGFSDGHSNGFSAGHSNDFSDHHSIDVSDRHSNDFSDRHSIDFSDLHSDDFGDRHSNDFSDRHSNDFSDRHSVDFSDRHSNDFSDGHPNDFNDGHSNDFSDGHSSTL